MSIDQNLDLLTVDHVGTVLQSSRSRGEKRRDCRRHVAEQPGQEAELCHAFRTHSVTLCGG
jgi:hypothetical protein